jgi:hypothetical protein
VIRERRGPSYPLYQRRSRQRDNGSYEAPNCNVCGLPVAGKVMGGCRVGAAAPSDGQFSAAGCCRSGPLLGREEDHVREAPRAAVFAGRSCLTGLDISFDRLERVFSLGENLVWDVASERVTVARRG